MAREGPLRRCLLRGELKRERLPAIRQDVCEGEGSNIPTPLPWAESRYWDWVTRLVRPVTFIDA